MLPYIDKVRQWGLAFNLWLYYFYFSFIIVDVSLYQCISVQKKKIFFEKLECRFLAEGTTIESPLFTYKTALSKPKLGHEIEWGVKKWTYHKERSFTTNYFIFSKI